MPCSARRTNADSKIGRNQEAIRRAVALMAVIATIVVPAEPRAGDVTTTITPAVIRPGDVFVLDVDCQCQATAAQAAGPILGQPIRFFQTGEGTTWRAIGGIDLDARPGTYALTISFEVPNSPAITTREVVRLTSRSFPTRRLQVDPGFVTPPADAEKRIVVEAARLRDTFGATSLTRVRVGSFQPPVPGEVNSNFGSRSIFNGQPRNPHAGVDFRGAVGTPVVAPASADVVLAEDLYFTGQTVVLDHGQGLYSILAHLSEIAVKAGAQVEGGQRVGSLGATGRVTGPHLHWGVRLRGARVDPLSVLSVLAIR